MAKTIKFAALIERTNKILRDSPDSARMDRIIIHTFICDLLLTENVYGGFGYIQPYGEPGSDSSRTQFYTSHKLR